MHLNLSRGLSYKPTKKDTVKNWVGPTKKDTIINYKKERK